MSRFVPRVLATAAFILFTFTAHRARAQDALQQTTQSDSQQTTNTAQPSLPTGFFARYEARAQATQVNQPGWATPIITINPGIEQGFRADFVRQTAPGDTTWNYGDTKGLQIIPFPRTELRISPPPFFTHSNPKVIGGFGDMAFRLKYRLYGSNKTHHNAIATLLLAASLPTGKNGNGSCCAIVTPTAEFGKGFGHLVVVTSLSATLPASGTKKLGRSIGWNNAVEYQVTHLVWLTDEFDSTFYLGGKDDGRQQTFATPGIVVSRIPIVHARPGLPPSLALTFAAGEQIALTRFNTYNHSPVFRVRFSF